MIVAQSLVSLKLDQISVVNHTKMSKFDSVNLSKSVNSLKIVNKTYLKKCKYVNISLKN